VKRRYYKYPRCALFSIPFSLYFSSSRWCSGIELGYGLDNRGFESRQELGIFLLTTESRPALRPTQLPIQWVPGSLFMGVKRPRSEAEHSLPSSAEVKNAWSYASTRPLRLRGLVVLSFFKKKAQGRLYLAFIKSHKLCNRLCNPSLQQYSYFKLAGTYRQYQPTNQTKRHCLQVITLLRVSENTN
jgi:hypothetical protein